MYNVFFIKSILLLCDDIPIERLENVSEKIYQQFKGLLKSKILEMRSTR